MLTATYSQVAIRAEQDKAHRLLSRLRQHVANAWQGLRDFDLGFLENAFSRLLQFDDYCRMRKIELYLVPVLRRVSREADRLIAELDELSASCAGLLRAIGARLAGAFEAGGGAAHEICDSMERYCNNMQLRLRREDEELLPLARRLLSVEEWFAVAAQCLSDEAGSCRTRTFRASSVPQRNADEARPS